MTRIEMEVSIPDHDVQDVAAWIALAVNVDAPPGLVVHRLIVANWRVGSAEWSWEQECADLADDPVTAAVRLRALTEGIGFADAYAPILLGSDGRVWDGHHRIVIALEQGITHVNAECVTPPGRTDQ